MSGRIAAGMGPGKDDLVRSIRLLRNIATNYLRFILMGLMGFVLTPLMVRWLGDGDYGLWVTIFSLTGYFGLFDQGIRPSLVRYVSRDHANGDVDGLSRTLSGALALYGAAGILTLIATIVATAYFPVWFRIDPAHADTARATVLLSGLTLALGFPFGVFGATLSGMQRYDIGNAIGILVGVARTVGFIVVLRLDGGLVGLAAVSLVLSLVGHALSTVFALRLLPGVRLAWNRVGRHHLAMIGSYGGFAFIGALANSVTFQADALVITALLGAAQVTPFALAAGLIDSVRSLVYSATFVLSPTASELETKGEAGKLHAMMIAGSKYSVLLSWPVLFGLIVFGENLLVTWVGPGYGSAAVLITILAVPTLLSLPQSATCSVLYGISRHKGVVALSLLNAATNLGLSLLWAVPYGLVGVALGTAVPLGVIGGVAMMVFGCRALALPLPRYLWEGIGRPGLAALAFLVPAVAVQWRFHPTGWVPLFAACAGSWVVFAAVAWRFALTREERGKWGRMMPRLLRGSGAAMAGAGR